VTEPSRFGIDEWDRSYAIEGSSLLWGDPVPFVASESHRWLDPASPGLEVPCGDGRNTPTLARHFERLTALDSSDRALQRAAAHVHAEKLTNVAFFTGNVYRMPFRNEEFGSVICWDLLAHLKEPEGALREIARVCRAGGSIVANVYSRADSTRGRHMVELRPNEYLYADRFYYRYYSAEDVEELIARAGSLDIVKLTTSRWTEPPHDSYRSYEHDHESWVAVLCKRVAADDGHDKR
jgi:ubiquinone/menaquinone biosynthesis C-methylase UbiE